MERSNKLLLGAIFGVACGWLTYKYFLAPNPRQKRTRRRVGVISQIFIHPFKSGRGILVDSAFAGEKGLNWNGLDDRGWCVRESKNNVKVRIVKWIAKNLEFAKLLIAKKIAISQLTQFDFRPI